MSTQDFDLTLRLRWGYNSAREITVPVEIRKGSYSGRYELYIDGTHIGWVLKHHDGLWHGYLSKEQLGLREDYKGHQAALSKTRRDAMEELVFRLSLNARTNVLAARSKAAYADVE